MVTVASFYCERKEDFPDAPDYIPLLGLLQASCDKFGHRHVVISDKEVPGFETHVVPLPRALMPAILFGQRDWIAAGKWRGYTVMVGADCLVNQNLEGAFEGAWDICFTSRVHARWPINTGAIYLKGGMRIPAAQCWARMASRVSDEWGDDQVQFAKEFGPVPPKFGSFDRHLLHTKFVPMVTHNDCPRSAAQPSTAYVVHFKGKRKAHMAAWAKQHLQVAA